MKKCQFRWCANVGTLFKIAAWYEMKPLNRKGCRARRKTHPSIHTSILTSLPFGISSLCQFAFYFTLPTFFLRHDVKPCQFSPHPLKKVPMSISATVCPRNQPNAAFGRVLHFARASRHYALLPPHATPLSASIHHPRTGWRKWVYFGGIDWMNGWMDGYLLRYLWWGKTQNDGG